MNPKIFLRTASIAAIFLIATTCSSAMFVSLYVSLGLTHTAISFIYSRKRLEQMLKENWLMLVAMALLSMVTAYSKIPAITYFFGIHHILTEAYFIQTDKTRVSAGIQNWFVASRIMLNAFIYVFALRYDVNFVSINPSFLVFGIFVSGLFFIHSLIKLKPFIQKSEIVDYCILESAGLMMAVASLFTVMDLFQVAFYHFVLWTFLPILQEKSSARFSIPKYALLTLGLMVIFMLTSPVSGLPFAYTELAYKKKLIFWGYIHITCSFFLSSYNPAWVVGALQKYSKKDNPKIEPVRIKEETDRKNSDSEELVGSAKS